MAVLHESGPGSAAKSREEKAERIGRYLRNAGCAAVLGIPVSLAVIILAMATRIAALGYLCQAIMFLSLGAMPFILLGMFVHTALFRVQAYLQEVLLILIVASSAAGALLYMLQTYQRFQDSGQQVTGLILAGLAFALVCAGSLWGLGQAKKKGLTEPNPRIKCLAAGWGLAFLIIVPMFMLLLAAIGLFI
ncbi:MAG: hypothetical protein KIS92_03775 [Planctomycetota bacterium]|nr:hypothetical protein [Planctomycetota bacterium]